MQANSTRTDDSPRLRAILRTEPLGALAAGQACLGVVRGLVRSVLLPTFPEARFDVAEEKFRELQISTVIAGRPTLD